MEYKGRKKGRYARIRMDPDRKDDRLPQKKGMK
jgi:hypothetical protein